MDREERPGRKLLDLGQDVLTHRELALELVFERERLVHGRGTRVREPSAEVVEGVVIE